MLNRRLSGIGEAFRCGKPEIITVGVIVLIVTLAGAIGINLAVVPDEYAGRILATASRNRGIVAMLDELLTRPSLRGRPRRPHLLSPAAAWP